MRPITLYALIGITVLALAAAIASAVARSPVSDIARGARLFPGLEERLDQLVRLDVARGEARITLERTQTGWVLPAKGNYPARTQNVRQLLAALVEMDIVEAKTSKPDLFGRLDLTDRTAPNSKAIALTLIDGKGAALAELLVGKPRMAAATGGSDGAMVYVRKPQENQTWLAQGTLDLPQEAVDWAERDLMDLAVEKVTSVRLTDDKSRLVFLEKPSLEKNDFVLRALPQGRDIKSQFELNGVASALEGLRFDDVSPAPNPAGNVVAKAEYSLRDGLVVTVSFIEREGARWASITASASGEEAVKEAQAIQAKTSGWIYLLPDWKRQKMQASLETLLKPKDPA